MTSDEFEVAAKNAVIEALREYEIETEIRELQLVWFAHVLGNKKCTVWGKPMGKLYAEVTYNCAKDQMYVDIYHKEMNICLERDEMKLTVD